MKIQSKTHFDVSENVQIKRRQLNRIVYLSAIMSIVYEHLSEKSWSLKVIVTLDWGMMNEIEDRCNHAAGHFHWSENIKEVQVQGRKKKRIALIYVCSNQ